MYNNVRIYNVGFKSIMKKLDTLTYSLAENCLSKNNLFEAKLILNWDQIFSKYSHVVKPIKVQFMKKNNKNGTLVLEVKRGFELEIQMEQVKILNLANNFFGFKAIDKIKIIKNGYN